MRRLPWSVPLSLLLVGAGAAGLVGFTQQATPLMFTQAFTPVFCRKPTLLLRGDARLSGGTVTIQLPAYFERLAPPEGRHVQLTCQGGWSPLYASEVVGGCLTVSTKAGGDPAQAFWWEIKAGWIEQTGPVDYTEQ